MLAFVLAATIAALGEESDPAKLAPRQWRVLFENEQVRVLKWLANPGEATPMHAHGDLLYYPMKSCRIQRETADGRSEEQELKAGEPLWRDSAESRQRVLKGGDCNVLVVELKDYR